MEPTIEEVAKGGSVLVIVVGALVWAIRTIVSMLQAHLTKVEATFSTFSASVTSQLGEIKTEIVGMRSDLADVIDERDREREPAVPRRVSEANGGRGI